MNITNLQISGLRCSSDRRACPTWAKPLMNKGDFVILVTQKQRHGPRRVRRMARAQAMVAESRSFRRDRALLHLFPRLVFFVLCGAPLSHICRRSR